MSTDYAQKSPRTMSPMQTPSPRLRGKANRGYCFWKTVHPTWHPVAMWSFPPDGTNEHLLFVLHFRTAHALCRFCVSFVDPCAARVLLCPPGTTQACPVLAQLSPSWWTFYQLGNLLTYNRKAYYVICIASSNFNVFTGVLSFKRSLPSCEEQLIRLSSYLHHVEHF